MGAQPPRRRIPWYVWVCCIIAFLGGGFTVVICFIAFIVIVIGAALQWFAAGVDGHS